MENSWDNSQYFLAVSSLSLLLIHYSQGFPSSRLRGYLPLLHLALLHKNIFNNADDYGNFVNFPPHIFSNNFI